MVALALVGRFEKPTGVRWLQNSCSALFAALWLVASSHVGLEAAGFIHQGDHADAGDKFGDQSGDSDHDSADGKCPISNVKVSLPKAPAAQTQICCLDFWTDSSVLLIGDIHCSGLPPPKARSIPIVSWQFCLRAALAPRAPSLFS
jgi:hypothetical protein